MQINLSTSLPNSAGEATGKSTEPVNTGSASAFFAQMDQIQIPDTENNKSQPAEKSMVRDLSTNCSDPMRLLLAATMLCPNPANSASASNPDLPVPTSTTLQNGDDQSANTQATIRTGIASGSQGKLTFSTETESIRAQADKKSKDIAGSLAALEPAQVTISSILYPSELSAQAQTTGGQRLCAVIETEAINAATPDPEEGFAGSKRNIENPNTGEGAIRSGKSGENACPEEGVLEGKQSIENSNPVEEIAINKQGMEAPSTDAASVSPEAIASLHSILPDISQNGEKPQKKLLGQYDSSISANQDFMSDSKAKPENTAYGGNSHVSQNTDKQNKSLASDLNKSEGMQSSGTDYKKIDRSIVAQEPLRNESGWQKVLQVKVDVEKKDFSVSSITQAESRQELSSQSNWSAVNDDHGFADQPLLSQDSKAQDKISQAIPTNIETIVQTASDNANSGGSNANQDQAHTALFAWTVLQNKSENGQTTAFIKSQASIAEHPQEMRPALTSNPVSLGESTNFTDKSPAAASTSQSRELILQLADQMQIQLREGKEEIRIQLKPDTLGRIEIRAETTSNGVTARITTESSTVKTYLENNLQLLQQTLNDQGLRVERIHVVVQDAFDSQSSSGYSGQFGYPGSGRNGRESNIYSEASGSLTVNPADEITVDALTWLDLNPNNKFSTIA